MDLVSLLFVSVTMKVVYTVIVTMQFAYIACKLLFKFMFNKCLYIDINTFLLV